MLNVCVSPPIVHTYERRGKNVKAHTVKDLEMLRKQREGGAHGEE